MRCEYLFSDDGTDHDDGDINGILPCEGAIDLLGDRLTLETSHYWVPAAASDYEYERIYCNPLEPEINGNADRSTACDLTPGMAEWTW